MTGANRGLGYAIARQLTERGDIHVAATARELAQAHAATAALHDVTAA
jgi:NAD(P)-dependent dehydrogenase (short-subunit alcohol dehydrogenase family)